MAAASGVYRSDNAGQTWVGLVYPPEGMFAKFNEITALALDPSDNNHLLTIPGDFATVLYSYDKGQHWQIGDFLKNSGILQLFLIDKFAKLFA